MDEKETLAELETLLPLYPGVTVDFVQRTARSVRLVLRVNAPESLARIVRCAAASNLPMHVWMRGPGRVEAAKVDPGNLRFELRIVSDRLGSEPPSPLEILGINLVWDLVAYESLSRDQANRFLEAWNGARV